MTNLPPDKLFYSIFSPSDKKYITDTKIDEKNIKGNVGKTLTQSLKLEKPLQRKYYKDIWYNEWYLKDRMDFFFPFLYKAQW